MARNIYCLHSRYIRMLCTINVSSIPKTATTWITKEEIKGFMSIFPDLVRDLTDNKEYEDIPLVTNRIARVLEYNAPFGKHFRGLTTVASYKVLETQENLTSDNIRLAQVLGWCVELVHTFFIIIDDISDSSETRRGSPCWYLVEGTGMQAINDATMISYGISMLLKKYFCNHHCYIPVIELFQETILKSFMGQTIDVLCMKNGKPQFDSFTVDRYNSIVKYKAGYYTFQLPIAIAMYLARKYDAALHKDVITISLAMGHYFQVQDDFLDCFGDHSKMGKNGTDIQDGKCSWLAVQALQRASPEQRITFEQNYGKTNPESVDVIRSLYEDLDLRNAFALYEEETYNFIRSHIQHISHDLPQQIFFNILDAFYKRHS